MSDTAITATLDRERTLDVRPHLIELERTTGVGVGRLVARIISGEFSITDLTETVRLGLLGGGATPAEAVNLTLNYVAQRPLTEGHALATEVLLAAWNGTARKVPKITSEPVSPAMLAEAGEVILDAPGGHPQRVENDGSLTPVRALPNGRYVPLEAAP